MKILKRGTRGMAAVMSVLLLLTGSSALAGNKKPLTPELAAKKEMVRKQHEQRPTHNQKQVAADNLKAERLKIYNAKQAAQREHTKPAEYK